MSDGGYWNYRVMRRTNGAYIIVEAYYDADGKLMGYTDQACPYGESWNELVADLETMFKAFVYDVLEESAEP